MTGVAATALTSSAGAVPAEFDHLLTGQAVAGAAAELATRLDPAFLAEAGWDPVGRVLSLPAAHPLLGRKVCLVPGCMSTANDGSAGALCSRCFNGLAAQGLSRPSIEQIETVPVLPPGLAPPAGCAVPGCQRTAPRSTFCGTHSSQFRHGPGASMSVEQFVAAPRVRPLHTLGPCRVAACPGEPNRTTAIARPTTSGGV